MVVCFLHKNFSWFWCAHILTVVWLCRFGKAWTVWNATVLQCLSNLGSGPCMSGWILSKACSLCHWRTCNHSNTHITIRYKYLHYLRTQFTTDIFHKPSLSCLAFLGFAVNWERNSVGVFDTLVISRFFWMFYLHIPFIWTRYTFFNPKVHHYFLTNLLLIPPSCFAMNDVGRAASVMLDMPLECSKIDSTVSRSLKAPTERRSFVASK